MRIKVTKKQFKLLLDNFHIIKDKELELEMTVKTLNYVLDLHAIPNIGYSHLKV